MRNFPLRLCKLFLRNQPEISLLLHTGATLLLGTAGVILVFRAPAIIFFGNRKVRPLLGATIFVAVCISAAKFGILPNQ
jgi:hypothetical protein